MFEARPARRLPMHLLWSLPLVVAALYAALLALLWFGQERLIFLPQKVEYPASIQKIING